MKYVTFNPLRTIGIPNTKYIKPELMFQEKEGIQEADWLLFPEYWQVNSLVYGLKKRIFPSIETFHLGHDKIEMTRVLNMIVPEHVPYTQILASTDANVRRVLDECPMPFMAKEVRNSQGKGVFYIENEAQFHEYARQNRVLYVQEYLPIDRDMRLVYVGDEVIGAYWRIGDSHSHLNNISQGGHVSYEFVPYEAVQLVEDIAKRLNINHAGFDVALVNDHLYIFEFNVLFGNIGLKGLKMSVEEKIQEYLRKQHSPNSPFTPFPSPRVS
ncbi:ATP-grasp domain-containing protein [Caldalkalibacillus salinus]|uniref:ATP-grasp domain-containing protein n=1 Tax=Caldalkalibacillus salinus TaxID=2803787 RepID=UPI0019220D9E|nr:hypothetical protein [Caldalkalibacillus salinus]